MNKKHHTIIYYITVWTLIVIFTISSITLIIAQTYWGREKVKAAFILYAKTNNINLKIESIKGLIPFEYKLENVRVILENDEIDIKTLDCRINILPLIRNKLSFRYFSADHISIKSKKTLESPQKKIGWLTFPITVKFDKLKLENFFFKINESTINLNVSGKAQIEKNGETITAEVVVRRKGYDDSYLDLTLNAIKQDRSIDFKSYLSIHSLKVLDFLIKNEAIDTAFDINFETNGSLDSYLGYLVKNGKKYSQIQGSGFGNIFSIHLKNKPYNLVFDNESAFSFDFSTQDNLNIEVLNAHVSNDFYNINLDALISKNFSLDKSNISIKIDDLSKMKTTPMFFGSFNMQTTYDSSILNSNFSFQNFRINDEPFADFTGNISGQIEKNILNGNISSSFFALEQIFNISSDYKFEKYFLNFSNLKVDSASSSINANLTITPAFAIIGDGKIHFEDLKQIQILYPMFVFYGLTDIDFAFKQKIEEEKPVQNLVINLVSNDYHLKTFVGKTLNISMNIDDPFTKPLFDLDIKINDLKYRDLHFAAINFTTSTKQENWPYTINLSGDLRQPFNIDSNGFWRYKKDEFILNLQDLSGHLFTHNFITPKPVKLEITDKNFLLTELSLELADSSIFADINLSKLSSKGKIKLKHIPLDFLSVNPLDLDVSGFATLNMKLEGNGNDIDSKLDLDLEELNILSLGDVAPLQAYGKLKSEIKNNYFNFDGSLNVKETQLFSFKGKIPIDIDIVKLSFKPNVSKAVNLALKYNGKIEEILDFIDIGSQRLEGELSSQIELTNKIEKLDIKGFCSFKKGYYENYYTGTIIKDIEANIKATNDKITLVYLKGKDTEKGSVNAEGLFSISLEKNFPFYFKTEIKDLLCVDSDIFKGIATANIEILGDRFSSIAKGNVLIDKLEMTIPDKLPINIPDLKPLFVFHPFQSKEKIEESKPTIYPFHLNLDIDASKIPISISGQGLTSTWQGLFKIGGSYMSVETRGGLELLKGEFVFSGRKFILSKGSVVFDGVPNGLPNLDLQAKMTQQGVDLFANLKGPIDAPKIYFTSAPPLPASSILALLIFGQPLSDLSASQTLDLSYTMSTQLAPSELTKSDSISSLGIDRFNVVEPSPTDPYGTDQMAVQLGKYISKGLVISYSQGEEQGTSNVIVEIDLRKGFIFQAESQQEKEQGKFTLKYRYNY